MTGAAAAVMPPLRLLNSPGKIKSSVDEAFSICYHHCIHDTGYCLWRMFPRATSLERRCRDDQKRIPRNIDARHEGMELHRGCPGNADNVDTQRAFRVIRILNHWKLHPLFNHHTPHLTIWRCLPLPSLSCWSSLSRILTIESAHVFLMMRVE